MHHDIPQYLAQSTNFLFFFLKKQYIYRTFWHKASRSFTWSPCKMFSLILVRENFTKGLLVDIVDRKSSLACSLERLLERPLLCLSIKRTHFFSWVQFWKQCIIVTLPRSLIVHKTFIRQRLKSSGALKHKWTRNSRAAGTSNTQLLLLMVATES